MLQIYIPNVAGADPQHLRDVGLEDLLRDGDRGPEAADLIGTGPDGQRGAVFFWQPCELPGYRPERQTWTPAKPDRQRGLPSGRFWIGRQAGFSPSGDALMRDEAARLPGYPITLGDGNSWTVPNGMKLPFRMALDEAGDVVRQPTRSVDRIAERTLWAFATLEKQIREDAEIDYAEAARYAAEMLSINYRVNLEICLLLELFDATNLGKLLLCTTDYARLIEIEQTVKKNAAGGSTG